MPIESHVYLQFKPWHYLSEKSETDITGHLNALKFPTWKTLREERQRA